MAKTIFPEQGFTIADLLSEDGVTLDMNNELCGIDEEPHQFSKDVFMSNDEMLKYLNMDDVEIDEESNEIDARMPWDFSFEKIRLKMDDLLGNGSVMKLQRREGVGEIMPENAQVSVRYIGFFEYQDEPFDASYNRGRAPDILHLGQGDLIEGLEVALRSMKKHEISIFLIKPEYAYGEMGCLPRIPPNQEVLFNVHLVDYANDGLTYEFHKLSIEERKAFPNVKKNVLVLIAKAGENFKKEKLRQAINIYTKAARMLEESHLAGDEEEDEQKKLLTRVYTNLAICFNKENKPRSACAAFNKMRTPSAKAYFNHGRALIRLGEFNLAREELITSRKMEPRNQITVQELQLAKELNVKFNSLKERLVASSFLFTGAETVSPEFINTMDEICRNLHTDINVMRIVLPGGFTVDEDKCMRHIAVSYGFLVVDQNRQGKDIIFLAKPGY